MTQPRVRYKPTRTAHISAFERLVLAQNTSYTPTEYPLKTDCWIWSGSVCNKGYGCMKVGGRNKRVHIAAWEMATGRKVRPGFTLDHLCRNKACWRPSHMDEVTRSVNTARGNRANPRDTTKMRARPHKPGCACFRCNKDRGAQPEFIVENGP